MYEIRYTRGGEKDRVKLMRRKSSSGRCGTIMTGWDKRNVRDDSEYRRTDTVQYYSEWLQACATKENYEQFGIHTSGCMTTEIFGKALGLDFKKTPHKGVSIERRLEAMRQFYEAGVQTSCFISLIFPGITDVQAIIDRAKKQCN
ncbi:MAG: hypothetical protein IJ151_05355 [Bacteroidales bacterium]|nr:hypothetical protein [Bacteroidales bacterium]